MGEGSARAKFRVGTLWLVLVSESRVVWGDNQKAKIARNAEEVIIDRGPLPGSVAWIITNKAVHAVGAIGHFFTSYFTGPRCTASCPSFFKTLRKTNKRTRAAPSLGKEAWRVNCLISSYPDLRRFHTWAGAPVQAGNNRKYSSGSPEAFCHFSVP